MDDRLAGAFLLLSFVTSNFTSKTVSPDFLKMLQRHYFLRLIIIILLIFFTVNFTGDNINIKDHLINTFVLFFFYLLMTKSDIEVFGIIIFIISINYFINTHLQYLAEENKQNTEEYKKYEKYSSYITNIAIITSFVGFSYKCYKLNKINKNFNPIKYLFSGFDKYKM